MKDFDNTLVSDIYYKLNYAWSVETVPENNEILGRIKNNIKNYGNLNIEEIDKEHSWVKIESPAINDQKFIRTKGYEKHLEKCNKIDADYKKSLDEYNEKMKNLSLKDRMLIPYPLGEQHPIPWDNFLILKAYRCILTKSIGYTYYVKNTYMIKPFHIISHKWKFKDIGKRGDFEYICKSCEVEGIKYKNMPSGEIFPVSDFMLSCNEQLIKKLLE